MAEEQNWYIAVVNYNTERACEEKLRNLLHEEADGAFATYVPVQRELREQPSTGRRVCCDRLLCPGLLFIRCVPQLRYRIACRAKFIHHFLMDRARQADNGPKAFAIVPHAQMELFQRMVGQAETPVTIDPTLLRAGSKVRVKSGRFEGIEGILDRDPDGSPLLALRVNILGYAKMAFPLALLQMIE